jgi:hypothetical protein
VPFDVAGENAKWKVEQPFPQHRPILTEQKETAIVGSHVRNDLEESATKVRAH